MADVEDYSTTAASNTDDFTENQAPSTVNDAGRETQADIAAWHQRTDGVITAGGTADALTATYTPAHTSLVDGRIIVIQAASDNTTTTPTLNLDTLGAQTITKFGTEALSAGDIQADAFHIFKYDATNTNWELLNPAIPPTGTVTYSHLTLSNDLTQGDIGADSVGQSEIKETSGTVGGTIASGSGVLTYTLSGGNYGLSRAVYASQYQSEATFTNETTLSGNGSYFREATHSTTNGNSHTLNTREYYINSSPPYNLGDGDIAQFVFVVIDNSTGEIEQFSSYQDPVWAYNGPTNLTPSRYGKDGKVYRKRKAVDFPLTYEQSLKAGRVHEYLQAYREAPEIEEEITFDLKNADMNVVPHPFMAQNLTGKTVALLDPVSPLMLDLLEVQNHDIAEISEVILGGYIKTGNSPIKRKGPKGLLIPSAKWKV